MSPRRSVREELQRGLRLEEGYCALTSETLDTVSIPFSIGITLPNSGKRSDDFKVLRGRAVIGGTAISSTGSSDPG